MVVEKRNGKICYLKTIDISSDDNEIQELMIKGKQWISKQLGQQDMFLEYTRKQDEKEVIKNLLNKVENILLNGTQMILYPVFRYIRYGNINDDILKHL